MSRRLACMLTRSSGGKVVQCRHTELAWKIAANGSRIKQKVLIFSSLQRAAGVELSTLTVQLKVASALPCIAHGSWFNFAFNVLCPSMLEFQNFVQSLKLVAAVLPADEHCSHVTVCVVIQELYGYPVKPQRKHAMYRYTATIYL